MRSGLLQKRRQCTQRVSGDPCCGGIERLIAPEPVGGKQPSTPSASGGRREQEDGKLVPSRREQRDIDADGGATRRGARTGW
jgi:hypothetical protein